MYDFRCVYIEFLIDFVTTAATGLIILIYSYFWDSKKRKNGRMILGIFFIGFCIYITAFQYIPACVNPEIGVFEGDYYDTMKNSRRAIITRTYSFSKVGEKSKETFTLDSISKKSIYPDEFEKGETYRIYYEKHTDIIVRVED